MPTYEYKCNNCGYIFEAFQSIKENPLKICPKCNKNALKRLISGGAGLIFKGSGFYLTDYKKKSSPETKIAKEIKPKEDKETKQTKEKNITGKKTKNK